MDAAYFRSLVEVAKRRWLVASEVHYILVNHNMERCPINIQQQIVVTPESGSLILYDRSILKSFRADGYDWKRKEGQGNQRIKESNQKLKVNQENVIKAFYATHNTNDNFQRRIYTLLNGENNIVLVHYRNSSLEIISEGPKFDVLEATMLMGMLVNLLLDPSVSKGNFDPTELVSEFQQSFKEMNSKVQENQVNSSDLSHFMLMELVKDKFHRWIYEKTVEKCHSSNFSVSQFESVIHFISALGFVWALKPLLELGVNVNSRGVDGRTALHWAAQFGRDDMAVALVHNGASTNLSTNPTERDPVMYTPADIARKEGFAKLADLLSDVASSQ